MRGGRIRNPLERALMVATILVVVALALWLATIIVSWWSDCPDTRVQVSGLDKGISLWPPGAQCHPARGSAGVYEVLPWIKWLILGLPLTAVATVIVGLAASINSLRSRPRPGRV